MAVIEDRARRRPRHSYTTQLLEGGLEAIGAKVCEEAAELVEAAGAVRREGGPKAVVHEAADLVYHMLVLLGYCGIRLADVEAELTRRFGVSGLQEKATRQQPSRDDQAMGDG
jgi:phosphoribosyl-ATP pyrophosphohydrolase